MTLHIPDLPALLNAPKWLVACYCAAWCDTCMHYHDKFATLSQTKQQMIFVWIDIEDHPEYLGDEDIESFPTILVQHASRTLFFGPMAPHINYLKRLLDVLAEDAPGVLAKLPDVGAMLAR